MTVGRMTEPSISHPPRAGDDPELLPREHAIPKAASTLAAPPSTPLARISNKPVAVHSFSFPTTCLPLESREATVTIPDYGGLNKKEALAILIDKRCQRTEFRSWSFKSEVSLSSQYPRTAMLWIGEAGDAQSVDGLKTSASITGEPFRDFGNLDFKIASGLR